jgi:hypothetical protein
VSAPNPEPFRVKNATAATKRSVPKAVVASRIFCAVPELRMPDLLPSRSLLI